MYKHKEIEKKWQQIWEETEAFKTTDKYNKKFYVLDMFPYPSGAGLHVGHPQGYTATDIIARYKRLNGFDVLHPIGWDAFGLPAEQYALNTGNQPHDFTQKNIPNFRRQLKALGFSFDPKKEVDTTDPKYYKWTQWIFKKLYEQGLAEIKEIDVNWCPELGTVLANEEVLTDENGNKVSERGGFPVFKKPMKQWVLKITAYADKLLEGLEEVDFPESLKSLQSNWIGKSEGAKIKFTVVKQDLILEVFTTRADTIFGAEFIAIAPDHPLIKNLVTPEQEEKFTEFLKKYQNLSDRDRLANNKDKEGVFTGSYAINPITQKQMPIWAVNYVFKDYGTGIVMAVPAHDERDFDLAQKYDLPIKQVIKTNQPLPYTGDGIHYDSEFIDGLKIAEANKKVIEVLATKKLCEVINVYKLRDWIFSRQRYWGEPFPVLFDEAGNVELVEELVELPHMEKIAPSGSGESPLANNHQWVNVEINGKKYRRETNTMPQWAGSSWYYLAYIMKNDDGSYLDLDSPEAYTRFQKWLPVDLYIGGQEHAVLHLLYARFWHKVLFDLKCVPTSEPFYKIVNQGMILGTDNQKMSKSKGNVINPDDIVEELGADTLRVYEMFMGPLTETKSWSVESIKGIKKWLDRVWNLYNTVLNNSAILQPTAKWSSEFEFVWHNTIKEVTQLIEDLKFNVAISKLMVFVNNLYKVEAFVNYQPLIDLAILLSPFAPHLAEEFLAMLNQKQIKSQQWPKYDSTKTQSQTAIIAVQVNGKLRGTLEANINNEDAANLEAAKAIPNVAKHLETAKNVIKKTIYIKNKIINFII
ncbi:leucine--tRNA ligase [Candidatus Mycoplasma pogonae]